jgi:uncharacterized protein with NRDE domain
VCLLAVAWQAHPRYRLVLAANRDEFHARPTDPIAHWPSAHGPGSTPILAGRDRQAGGTWLGIDADRRVGVVTNFREPARPAPDAPSRGRLIPAFLANGHAPGRHLEAVEAEAGVYAGFNLLLADERELWYATNRTDRFARPLAPGLYGLSNGLIDTPWPKLQRLRAGLGAWVAGSAGAGETAGLFHLLADDTPADPAELPQTGLSPEWERRLSAPFIRHPDYGTRCSTVVLVQHDGAAEVVERRFDAAGRVTGETGWRLAPGEWPAGHPAAGDTQSAPAP